MNEGSILEKFAAIENAIRQMAELRQQVVQLQDLEKQQQGTIAGLQSREKELKTFLTKIPQKVFVKDKSSVYVLCNENYAADLKIRPEEIQGKTDFDFFPQEIAEKYRADDQRIMQTGQFEDREEKYVLAGQEYVIRMMKTPIPDESGQIAAVAGFFLDLTEQKRQEESREKERLQREEELRARTTELEKTGEELQREITGRRGAEEALKRAEENFGAVVGTAPLAIQVIQDGAVKFSNPMGMEIFRASRDEFASKPFTEFIHPEDREKVSLHLERVHDRGSAHRFICRILPKEENMKWLENRVSPTNWEGKPAILNFLVDVTQHKEAQEEMHNLLGSFSPLVGAIQKILSNLDRE